MEDTLWEDRIFLVLFAIIKWGIRKFFLCFQFILVQFQLMSKSFYGYDEPNLIRNLLQLKGMHLPQWYYEFISLSEFHGHYSAIIKNRIFFIRELQAVCLISFNVFYHFFIYLYSSRLYITSFLLKFLIGLSVFAQPLQ